ncbi:hypothetical protein NQ152_08330 [Microbacterium sp. zg.B48]|nr:hypothetical protein [Microbacterium sp. zg.B48]MCR2763517.1 hypothetical protein [Microbacterium sp. zg.B48]
MATLPVAAVVTLPVAAVATGAAAVLVGVIYRVLRVRILRTHPR